MSGPTFVRLMDGRLWHVSATKGRTMCDRVAYAEDAKVPELLQGHVPAGAWVCTRCRAAIADWLKAIDQAIAADPRGRRTEPLPVASEELTSLAEEVRVSRETPVSGPEAVDLVAALKASAEAAHQRRIEAMGDAS